MYFYLPVRHCLRGLLQGCAKTLLAEQHLLFEVFFDPVLTRYEPIEHLLGLRSWHYYPWDELAFQAWQEGQHV